MSKSSDKKIEEDKEKIILLLMEDSRQSPNEISEKLGFSRQKAWKLIKQLEGEKEYGGIRQLLMNVISICIFIMH